MRVGFPGALLYYQYYPLCKTFFELLGAEVVTTPPTNREMVTAGSSMMVAETCLPVKVFMGHTIYLSDKCDYMFVPAVRCVEKGVYNCSKFLGLPDMTRAVVPECPPILELDVDVEKGKGNLYRGIYKLGSRLTHNPFKVKRAAEEAWRVHHQYVDYMCEWGQTPLEVMDEMFGGNGHRQVDKVEKFLSGDSIALIGHPYLLYDAYVSNRVILRLRKMGIRVATPEMVREVDLHSGTVAVDGGAYWSYGRDLVGAGGYYLRSDVDGVIGVMAFCCGPDSLMMDTVRRYAVRLKKPFMQLIVDEHTADAGLITRLEAFVDMIHRNKRR
ncbi:MAG: hypothetical protein J7L90_00140 [Dehalococcoidia bacterium]|nr:hypothetical protein [Dehalococcoidia bacterium]